MPRSRSVWKDGQLFAEYVNGELTYLNPNYRPPARSDTVKMPHVMRDIGEYKSPIDGEMITSRSAHRDHLKRHDVIEVGNERMPTPTETPRRTREVGEAIKRHVEQVAEMPQAAYDVHVQQQAAEHAAVASLVTATP